MKRIKIGTVVIFFVVIVYCMISYGIFWLHKPSLDAQLQNFSEVNNQQSGLEDKNSVVIQNVEKIEDIIEPVCTHDDALDEFVFDDESDELLPRITQEKEQQYIAVAENFKNLDSASSDSYSFVTMPAKDCMIDAELYMTLDTLMGKNLDEFVRLVLQSNNNIVSKQACRSCGMYAFFNKIKRHHLLDVDDIIILQPLLSNLYRFVEKMQKLSKTPIMRTEQYEALQNLNKSQTAKNDLKLQQRKAATYAALKKLQTITYNR